MDLTSSRLEVEKYFDKMGKSANVAVVTDKSREKDLDLLDRLFQSYSGDRGIVIELGDDSLDFDYFTKIQVRYDRDVKLLYIVSRRPTDDLSKLWGMYYDWMHNSKDPDYLEEHYKRV